MNKVVISIGSNSSDREWQMANGIKWLQKSLSHIKCSSLYNTRAANGKDDDYLNAVIAGDSALNREDLEKMMKQYETVCGRTAYSKISGVIPIDIDIVMWEDKVLRERDYLQEYFQIGWKQLMENGK